MNPPSTARAWPVTKLALPEQSQTAASAISSARPSRPMGSIATIASTAARSARMWWSTISVSPITPGHTALTRRPCGAYSSAAHLVSPMTACLVAV